MRRYIFTILLFFLGLIVGVSLQIGSSSSDAEVYARYKNGAMTAQEVFDISGQNIFEMEKSTYFYKRNLIEAHLKNKILIDENIYVDTESVRLEQEEIEAAFHEAGLNVSTASRKVYQNIYDNLKLKKAKKNQSDLLQQKYQDLNVKYSVPLPQFRSMKFQKNSSPTEGSRFAAVEVLLFFNYHCSQCLSGIRRLEDLQKKFPDQLNVHYRFKGQDPEDSMAFLTMEAGRCANEQSHFLDFHKKVISHSPQDIFDIKKIAQEINLNEKKFNSCFDNRNLKDSVLTDQKESAILMNFYMEPVFVINNQVVSSLENEILLFDLIQREVD